MEKYKQKRDLVAILELLNRYARPLWKEIALLVFLTLLTNFFMTVKPAIVSGIMDVILKPKANAAETASTQNPLQKEKSFKALDLNHLGERVTGMVTIITKKPQISFWESLRIMLVIFLIVAFLAAFMNYLSVTLARWICATSTLSIRMDVLKHVLSLNLGFFHRQKSGELISRFTQDVKSTAYGLGPLLQTFINNSIAIIIYSMYLFNTSVWMAIGAIGMILLQFGLTRIIKRPIRRTVKNVFDRTADFTSTLQEMLTSMRVIKSFGAEDYELAKLNRDAQSVSTAEFKEGAMRQLEPNVRDFLDSFAIIGIFLIASFQFVHGSLSVQGFLLFIYVGQLLIAPINNLAVNATWLQALLASHERLDQLLSVKPVVIDGHINKRDFKEKIELKDVSFSYGAENVLNKVSFILNKGELLAFVGPSGAGKSTLTDLILRFYDPQEGEIIIDGTNLKELKVSSYCKTFGVVPQESLLFNDTVLNNIRYGRNEIAEKDIIESAKIANAHDFILELPQGYQTFVGDRGVRLSGGQRQRIAIARAIVSKPDILIFDEATSSLDTESERLVQLAIDRVLKKSTAIAIAHRLSTVLHADKIVVLNKGHVEAIGTHNELLEKCPIYHKLYELQFKTERKHI